jgi:hypothetical protein
VANLFKPLLVRNGYDVSEVLLAVADIVGNDTMTLMLVNVG